MKFLSQEWFDKVNEIRTAAGDIPVPEQIANTVINVTINDAEEGTLNEVHFRGGEFAAGHHGEPAVSLTLPSESARKVFLEMDAEAGMQAFFAGQIQVDGDVAKLMELQNYQPGADEKALLDKIVAITE